MSFRSGIPSSMPVIDDVNFKLFVDEADQNPKYGRGLDPSYKQPLIPGLATTFTETIPRSEWNDRIQYMEENRMRLPDLVDDLKSRGKWNGPRVLNQSQTNYCWINAPVHTIMLTRAKQGELYIPLSPASVGAKIKNFRNVGGWGSEGLKYIRERGVVPQSLWPANAIDRRYDNEESDRARSHFKCHEWYTLRPRNFDQLASCLLQNIPVAIGLNWWGHEVTAVALLRTGENEYAILIDNSWGENWGDKGRGVLAGTKMLPDDAVAPRVVTASSFSQRDHKLWS